MEFYSPYIPVPNKQYQINISTVYNYGTRLLEKDFYVTQDGKYTFVGGIFNKARQFDKDGDPVARDLIVAQFRFIFICLTILKDYNPIIFRVRKEKFLKLNTIDNFNGYLVELYIAVFCIEKSINFIWDDAPDFTAEYEGYHLFLEATSATRILQPTTDLRKKIFQSFNVKNKKVYAAQNGILFIDYTNIIFESNFNETLTNQHKLAEFIGPGIENSKFGCVVLCHTFINTRDFSTVVGFKPIYSKQIDKELVNFLEYFLSGGNKNSSGIAIFPKMIL